MRCISILVLLLGMLSTSAFTQSPINTFYIGHSLSDQIPDIILAVANDDEPDSFNFVYQSIPGAPLRWQWDHVDEYDENPPYYAAFNNPDIGLASGNFDVLVLTEAVPRLRGDLIEETYAYSDSLYQFATRYRPDIRVFLYEDWHCIESGTPTGCSDDIDSNPWRQRIDDDLPMWESVVDTLNTRFQPETPVCMIPGAQGLAALNDSIQVGAVPDVTRIEDLFQDRIHLTDQGKYFMSMIHYAMIFNKSPIGLPIQGRHWWGGELEAPSPELALKMQEIALETVSNYPLSCFNPQQSVANETETDTPAEFKLSQNYPNPFNPSTIISYQLPVNSEVTLKVFDMLGRDIATLVDGSIPAGSHSVTFDAVGLTSGMYFYQLQTPGFSQTRRMLLLK